MFAEERDAGKVFKDVAEEVDIDAPFVRTPPRPLLPFEILDLQRMDWKRAALVRLK